MKASNMVWNDEYNSMPLTPPPVPEGQVQPSQASDDDSPEPLKKRRGMMLGLIVVIIIGAGVIAGAVIPRERAKPPIVPQPEVEAKSPAPGTPEGTLEVANAQAAAALAPSTPPPLSKRHISIIADPPETTLALDGAVAGRHEIALDLMQDAKSHVVQATAPGYLPFKRNFTLQSDLNLHISLKKNAAPVVVSHPKPQPSKSVTAKPPETEPSIAPPADPVEDFGMDMNRPAVRRQTKKMDEKDPYSP